MIHQCLFYIEGDIDSEFLDEFNKLTAKCYALTVTRCPKKITFSLEVFLLISDISSNFLETNLVLIYAQNFSLLQRVLSVELKVGSSEQMKILKIDKKSGTA